MNNRSFLLGIDIGTSACKVTLFDIDGNVVADTSQAYNIYYPAPGMVEQDAEEWWQAVSVSVKRAVAESGINPSNILGVGIDGQSWSAVMVDKSGNPLYKVPIWTDTRSQSICNDVINEMNGPNNISNIFNICGNPFQPGYTLPKILWFKKHMPQVYKNTYKVLQSNSYIAFRLTGVMSQDKSQGYGLQCFDMRKGSWDNNMCGELGITAGILPDIFACHEIIGHVTSEAAKECGLKQGIPVVGGGLDAACAALGAGVLNAGEAQEQGGQAGGMSICLDDYRADEKLILSFHVVPDKWLLQGGTVGGGGVLKWLYEKIFSSESGMSEINISLYKSFAEMDMLAEKISPASEGMIFLPYMAGERSPIWDSMAKGVFYGLDFSKTNSHMIRACLEGCAYALRHNLETAQAAGANVKVLRAVGGSANSRLWTQIKADITGKEIVVPSSDTAATLGAAILAGVGTGVYASFEEAVAKTVVVKRKHEPNKSNKAVYDKAYDRYLRIYECLMPIMHNNT